MRHCKASPKLFFCCAHGVHIKKAVLTCRKAGGGSSDGKSSQQDYLRITLTNLLVSAYHCSHGHGPAHIERIGLHFAQVYMEAREQLDNGSMGPWHKIGYDMKTHQPL
jgi:type VI secretion system secreted protein Hcp